MKNTVLITGASSGIGLALAKVFAAHGCDLVLIARNEQKLNEVAAGLSKSHGVTVKVMAFDLSKPETARQIFNKINSDQIEIQTLVNNAGFAEYGAFASIPLDRHLSEIDLNIRSLTELSGLFLPGMISRRKGEILNIASTAAFQPGPLMAVYYATKAYVLSFSESLRNENKKYGIAVTALCPGPTKTAFGEKSELSKSRLLANAPMMSAERVAEAGYAGLKKNKAVVIPGFMNKFLAFGTRLLPRAAITAISRWTLDLK